MAHDHLRNLKSVVYRGPKMLVEWKTVVSTRDCDVPGRMRFGMVSRLNMTGYEYGSPVLVDATCQILDLLVRYTRENVGVWEREETA